MYKSINIYWSTLDYISTAKYQDMFAAFLLYKGLFGNSCVYNYSISNLSRISNLSYKTVKRHIEFMMSKNWVRIHNGNLVFKDCADIAPEKYTPTKKISRNETWRTKIFLTTKQDIKDQLLHMFMVNKQRRVLRIAKVRNGKTKYSYKKIKHQNTIEKQYGGVRPVLSEIANDFVISYHRIGLLNKMSKSSSFRAISRLKQSGVLLKRRNFKLLKANASKLEFEVLKQYNPKLPILFFKGNIYRVLPNSYCVIDKFSNSVLKDVDNANNEKNFKKFGHRFYVSSNDNINYSPLETKSPLKRKVAWPNNQSPRPVVPVHRTIPKIPMKNH